MIKEKEVRGSLATFGFNKNQINYAIDHMSGKGPSLEHLLEDAIQTITKAGKDAWDYRRKGK